jgi:putative pyruvate formate lyase activating enzyme
MAQYVPSGRAKHTPPFDRRVTQAEYEAVVDYLYMLGLEDGFLQEPSAATDDYLPDFSLEGV